MFVDMIAHKGDTLHMREAESTASIALQFSRSVYGVNTRDASTRYASENLTVYLSEVQLLQLRAAIESFHTEYTVRQNVKSYKRMTAEEIASAEQHITPDMLDNFDANTPATLSVVLE